MLQGVVRKLFSVFITKKAQVRFSRIHSSCIAYELDEDGTMKDFNTVVERTIGIVFVILPCISLLIINGTLVVFAVRSTNRRVNKKNLAIVLLVTLTFVVSFTPFAVQYQIFVNRFHSAPISFRIGLFIGMISSFSNPFIYIANNDTFKRFVKKTTSCFIFRSWASFHMGIQKFSSRLRSTQAEEIENKAEILEVKDVAVKLKLGDGKENEAKLIVKYANIANAGEGQEKESEILEKGKEAMKAKLEEE